MKRAPIVFLLVFGCAVLLRSQPNTRDSLSVRMVSVAGLKEQIAADSGNVVLLNVWATWCKPCKEEMPSLLRLRREHAKDAFRLILASVDDDDRLDTVVLPMLRGFGADFQTYLVHDSSDAAIISELDSSWSGALPTSFLYDKSGTIRNTLTGGRSYDEFEKAITALLSNSTMERHSR